MCCAKTNIKVKSDAELDNIEQLYDEKYDNPKIIKCKVCGNFIGKEIPEGIILQNALLTNGKIKCNCGRCIISHDRYGVTQEESKTLLIEPYVTEAIKNDG